MQDPRELGRRAFTAEIALALLAGATITVSGCGGGSSDEPYGATPVPTPQPNPTPQPTPTPTPTPEPQPTPTPSASPTPTPVPGRNGAVSGNHGHVARITSAQLTAGGAVSLDISGSAGHPHTVQLSASDVMAIAEGTRVSTTSSNELAHDHVVTFN